MCCPFTIEGYDIDFFFHVDFFQDKVICALVLNAGIIKLP